MSASPILDLLPGSSSDTAGDVWALEGYLIRGSPDSLRIVVASVVLEFGIGDVLDVVEIPEPIQRPMAIAARISLKRPAALLSVGPADAYAALIEPQVLPFAYVTRPGAPPMQAAPRFEELQAEFKRRLGVT